MILIALRRSQRGQALAELALGAPFLIGLFALTLQGGLVLDDQVNIQHFAYEGGQWAVANRLTATTDNIQNHVLGQMCGLDAGGVPIGTGSISPVPLTRYCRDNSLKVLVSSPTVNALSNPGDDPFFGPWVVQADAAACQQWDLQVTLSAATLSTGQSATLTVTLVGPNGAANPTGAGSAPIVTVTVSNLPQGLYNGTPYLNPPTITPGNATTSMTIQPTATTEARDAYHIKVSGLDQCGSGVASTVAEKDLKLITTGGTGPATPPAAPKVNGLLPLCVPTGQNLTINGSGYVAGSTVTIGGQAATVVSTTSTTITVTVPAAALPAGQVSQMVSVSVSNPGGGSVSLANAVIVGTCTAQQTQDNQTRNQAGSATPCFAATGGQAGSGVQYVITITWKETLVIPWITSAVTLTANQRAFCQ
jgi:hypothetical protein